MLRPRKPGAPQDLAPGARRPLLRGPVTAGCAAPQPGRRKSCRKRRPSPWKI